MPKPTKAASDAPTADFDDVAASLAAAAERGRSFYETALRTWGEEGHTFLEAMTRDGVEAFAQLQKCKSPIEAIGVEQAWLMARAKAYMDAGQRIFEAGLKTPVSPANEGPDFRLPE